MGNASLSHHIEQFERLCREQRLPVTTQRRAVFEAIIGRKDHPTADQIYDEVRERLPSISRTTVYRILDGLVQLGLITKICHPGSAARFDPKTHQHHHLVCLRCDTIIDLEEKRLNRLTWPDVRKHGFEIRDYHIHFRGICARCRDALSANRKGKRKSAPRRLPTPTPPRSNHPARKRRTRS
jgi:Fur family peroxide stress response transcriptional regulator